MAANRKNGMDDSYDAWAASNPRPIPVEVDVLSPIVRRPGRYPGRGRKPAAPRLIVHDESAEAIDVPEYNVDQQLEALTRKVIMRLHQEIQNYSVPQLLSGLHKCLQVRVLIQTLRLKGGGENVGSAVSRYSAAFQTTDDSSNRAGRGRRPSSTPADDSIDHLLEGVVDED